MDRFCSICGDKISRHNRSGLCFRCYNDNERQKKIDEWLSTGRSCYCVGNNKKMAIRYYINEQQQGRCAICGLESKWMGKILTLVLDHIDGDASNDSRNNLRLICPNCDSQTDTFKSKTKYSARINVYHEKHNLNKLI